jgi:hypothetical protein
LPENFTAESGGLEGFQVIRAILTVGSEDLRGAFID